MFRDLTSEGEIGTTYVPPEGRDRCGSACIPSNSSVARTPTVPTQSCYATVCSKERKEGRVVEVVRTLVFGAMLLLGAYLERSPVRAAINTAFVERNNGTDRHQDARKRRQTCGPSMDIEVHHAASYLIG
ncbi:MAG TPA: hypothetical protein VKP69_32670 [Isosphaeraceae bacterium]|nr:hypothetical protein [Isosphaeraceae bacterium]